MSFHRLTLAIFVLVVGATGVSGQSDSDCLPSCPTDCSGGEKVPNPSNCHQYFTCLQDCVPSDVVFNCSLGYKFDAVAGECRVDDGNVQCALCMPQCRYKCSSPGDVVAVRGDCNSAILCQLGDDFQISCSGDEQYFNGTACQSEETQCCDPCEVYCETANTEILDPTSCSHFYFCSEVGFPLAEDRYECLGDETFNGDHCEADAACEVYCGESTNTSSRDHHLYYYNPSARDGK